MISTRMVSLHMLILLLSIIHISNAANEHGHGHSELSRSILIDEIAEHIAATTKKGDHTVFLFKDIEKLLSQLAFQNCSKTKQSTNCNLCLTPGDILNWFGHNSSKQLSEEELREIAVGLTFFLGERPVNQFQNSAVCKTFTKGILTHNRTSDLFNLYLSKYHGKGNQLTEQSIEGILGNINKTIGHQLTTKKCFSAHDVLKGANVSATGFGKHGLEYVTSFIVLKLLKKTCISKEQHGVGSGGGSSGGARKHNVTKDYFLTTLFKEFGNSSHMQHHGFEKLFSIIFPAGNVSKATVTGGTGHEGHGHKRKRRSAGSVKKCHNAENLLEIFGIPEGKALDKEKFKEICPSLVQQMESGVCKKDVKTTATTKKPVTKKMNTWQPWVAAMVAIAIISFGSMIGVVVFPGKEKKWFPYVIMFLIALGVSVLVCDALLHLIPHALDLHGHHNKKGVAHTEPHHEEKMFKKESYLWKCLLVLGGVYLFFAFEILMHAFGGGHGHSHHGAHAHNHEHGHDDFEVGSPVSGDSLKVVHTEAVEREGVVIANDFTVKYQNGNVNGNGHAHKDVTIANGHAQRAKNKFKMKEVKSIAWMILIGDGVHNFMDGVAIGVAFSEAFPGGLHGGISTSIAILCHEIPHELSDFAVLIASGLTIKQSLIMNLISSFTAFAGGIVGVSLGTSFNASPWIFSITAGLFIYIALVDMLPEIMNNPLLKKTPVLSIVLDMIGMLLGLVIMFVLAAWEEDIKKAIH